MNTSAIPIGQISANELLPSKVWRFVPESGLRDETCVRVVDQLPVLSLDGCLVGTKVRLANGLLLPAILSNISLADSALNQHFLTLSLFRGDGERYDLARYHDVDFDARGPIGLSQFLGASVGDIFPIEYELPVGVVLGEPTFFGKIEAIPERRLSRAEIIALAVS